MKKFILLFLTLCFAVCAFGCDKGKVKNRTFDEAEVLAAAEALIAKSVLFNQIYYGAGIPQKADNPKTVGGYVEADPAFLSEHQISSLESLKAKTAEVYTEGECAYLFRTVLGVIYDGDTIVGYKRYIEDAGTLYVRSGAENLLPDDVTYRYDTLAVSGVEGETIFVSITATVKTAEGKTQDNTLRVRLLEEESGFRLDSMTYSTYYEKQ